VLAIQVRIGKGSYDNLMENLSKLKQIGLLEEYKTQFELLANRVLRLSNSHKLSIFLKGLRDDIRVPVMMFNPKTLNDAYVLARMEEECILTNTKFGKPVWGSFRNQGGGNDNNSSFNKGGGGILMEIEYKFLIFLNSYKGGLGEII
jgi:hypothetical protein